MQHFNAGLSERGFDRVLRLAPQRQRSIEHPFAGSGDADATLACIGGALGEFDPASRYQRLDVAAEGGAVHPKFARQRSDRSRFARSAAQDRELVDVDSGPREFAVIALADQSRQLAQAEAGAKAGRVRVSPGHSVYIHAYPRPSDYRGTEQGATPGRRSY